MGLLAITYPELTNSDFLTIQTFREANDGLYYDIVAPHFTLVFPSEGLSAFEFTKEIMDLAAGTESFGFTLRCATINKDAFNKYYHVLLVPDEGFSKIIKLHDKLYSRLLRPQHRLEIDFIPHIGIANSTDPIQCKKMVDRWNSVDFEIKGRVNTVTIVEYDGKELNELSTFPLRNH